jgi:hypothetical protein
MQQLMRPIDSRNVPVNTLCQFCARGETLSSGIAKKLGPKGGHFWIGEGRLAALEMDTPSVWDPAYPAKT